MSKMNLKFHTSNPWLHTIQHTHHTPLNTFIEYIENLNSVEQISSLFSLLLKKCRSAFKNLHLVGDYTNTVKTTVDLNFYFYLAFKQHGYTLHINIEVKRNCQFNKLSIFDYLQTCNSKKAC